MAYTSTNALSDTEEIALYPEPESGTTRGQINDWLDITVAGEISRGNKLREQKPVQQRPKDGYPVIIGLSKSCNGRKRHKRKVTKTSFYTSPCECSQRHTEYYSSMVPSTSYSQNTTRLRIKSKNQTRCTMRTAQLAVPSKRHCLDTWRNKSHILPEFMVDRLKQHVMDQRPVVHIQEAIECFRRRKPRINKKCRANTANDTFNKLNYHVPLRFADYKTFCLKFAQKMVVKLATPLKLTLNSELENISKVVSYDIAKFTQCKKHTRAHNIRKWRSIHTEVSNKITIWIAGILEDLKYKLLEEDLIEMEEKEGPVLDFLDEVVDKVLDICAPEPSIVYMKESDYFDSHSNLESTEDEPRPVPSNLADDQLTDSEHFKNEIADIINNLDNEPESISDKEHFRNEIDNMVDVLFNQHLIKITDAEYIENEIYDLLSIVCKVSVDKIDSKHDGIKFELSEGLTANDEERSNFDINDLNGSELSEMSSENTDDRSKKVMFSVSDMGFNGITTPVMTSYGADKQNPDSSHEQNHEHDQTKRNIYFAEPNNNLLSDADEFWPNDLVSAHTLRPTASVTKSISSLGKLWESDEKYDTNIMTPIQTDASIVDTANHAADEEKSAMSLVKMLQHGKKLNLLAEEDPRDEITKSIASLVNILQNDKHPLTADSANAVIAEKLRELNVELPVAIDVTKSIAIILGVLQDDEELSTPAEVTAKIVEKLVLFNLDSQNVEVSKSSSLLDMQKDETHLELPDNSNLKDTEPQDIESQKLHSLIAAILADKCDTQSQTERMKRLEVVILEPTGISGVDSKLVMNTIIDNTIPEQDKTKTKGDAADIRTKVKTKNKGIVTDRVENSTKLDHEWKVQLETAPAWITQTNAHGEPSENSMPAQARVPALTQIEVHKWCKDLDKGFKNLEIWRDWLHNTCKEIATLIRKRNACTCWNYKHTKNWAKLRNNVAKDALLWRKMNRRTHETFESFQKYGNMKIVSTKPKSRCACKNKSYYITQYRDM